MSLLRNSAAVFAAFYMSLTLTTPAIAASFDNVETSTDKHLATFEAVYIAPVKAELNLDVRAIDRTGNGDRPISDRDIADKANDLHSMLERAFARSFTIVDAPGPGVLTIEATLTDLVSTFPTITDYSRNINLSSNSIYTGGAEVTFLLSEDDQTLTTINDRRFGNLNDGRLRVGIWDDADRTFNTWARRLAKFVAKN